MKLLALLALFPLATFVPVGAQPQAGSLDRRTFLDALKVRFRSDGTVLQPPSKYDADWRLDDPRTAWQKDVVVLHGNKVTFGVALAYLASQELKAPFIGSEVKALVSSAGLPNIGFRECFGKELLRVIFNEQFIPVERLLAFRSL